MREGTVRVEGMRKLWEAEVGETGEGCDNWIKLGGQKVCSVAAFWEFVGEEQSGKEGVLSWLGSEKYVRSRPPSLIQVNSLLTLGLILGLLPPTPSITSFLHHLAPLLLSRYFTRPPLREKPSYPYSHSSIPFRRRLPRVYNSLSDGNPPPRNLLPL